MGACNSTSNGGFVGNVQPIVKDHLEEADITFNKAIAEKNTEKKLILLERVRAEYMLIPYDRDPDCNCGLAMEIEAAIYEEFGDRDKAGIKYKDAAAYIRKHSRKLNTLPSKSRDIIRLLNLSIELLDISRSKQRKLADKDLVDALIEAIQTSSNRDDFHLWVKQLDNRDDVTSDEAAAVVALAMARYQEYDETLRRMKEAIRTANITNITSGLGGGGNSGKNGLFEYCCFGLIVAYGATISSQLQEKQKIKKNQKSIEPKKLKDGKSVDIDLNPDNDDSDSDDEDDGYDKYSSMERVCHRVKNLRENPIYSHMFAYLEYLETNVNIDDDRNVTADSDTHLSSLRNSLLKSFSLLKKIDERGLCKSLDWVEEQSKTLRDEGGRVRPILGKKGVMVGDGENQEGALDDWNEKERKKDEDDYLADLL